MSTQNPIPRSPAEPPRPAPEVTPVAPLAPVRMGWGRRVVALLFVVAVVGITAAALRPRPPPPIAITAATARRGPITRLVTAAGKLQAATEVKLSANVSGDLLELDAHEGDRVKRGQVLGRIDSRRYDAQVAQQTAGRASAAADVELEQVKVAQLEQELLSGRMPAGTKLPSERILSVRQSLKELVPFGSPLLALIEQVRGSGSPVNEYKVDLGTPRMGGDRQVDLLGDYKGPSTIDETPNRSPLQDL